jgi:hypothetical protein
MTESTSQHVNAGQPPLPDEEVPPLPDEQPPPLPKEPPPDDGWEPVWDPNTQAFYFYNRFTQAMQWGNPRVPQVDGTSSVTTAPPGLGAHDRIPGDSSADSSDPSKRKAAGGYNPAIHGDYDPNADYAQDAQASDDELASQQVVDPNGAYTVEGSFNRFTGRWQASTLTPENFNDENKSNRQMNAFFDVDAAANSHDGRSLKAERQGKKLSKKEVKDFKQKRREKKEEKRRAWLRD